MISKWFLVDIPIRRGYTLINLRVPTLFVRRRKPPDSQKEALYESLFFDINPFLLNLFLHRAGYHKFLV